LLSMALAYGECYKTMPAGIWHIECLDCGMRFVQSDEDIKWARGLAHFVCPRCRVVMELLD